MTIKDILLDFIGVWSNQNKIYSVQCTVESVDVAKRICVCTPTDGSAEILNVRLEADIDVDSEDVPVNSDSKGWFVVPVVGSIVGVSFYSKTEAYISVWTEIDEIIVKTTLFTFNDGAFGGLIKIDDITTKLNNLVTEVNVLKDLYNSHIHITTATVGATPTPGVISPTTSTGSAMTSFNKDDYKNTKVIHG